ncbi:LysR family transcriptional regulator [Ottowia thiooxydans]|uniref:LysR family transcriptional regulator n=1 Tax=Ottowia thiooxydans TaxID=219182 RepID=UPI000428C7DD|nr:LysR family transcriptional regulator [Ottowia thiooxydans]
MNTPFHMPELRVLRQFSVVATSTSLRQAAERLNMSQPPLSVAMRNLEAHIGARLFERTAAGIVLTDAGKVLEREATALLSHANRAIELTRATAAGLAGEIRVAFITSAMVSFLPDVLATFSERYPEVRLRLVEAVSVEVADLLSTGKADIGFLSPPVNFSTPMDCQTVHADRLVAILPAKHPLASRKSIPLSALAQERFVSFSADRVPAFSQRIVGACLEVGFQPRIVQEAAHIFTIQSLVAGNFGVALVPGSAAGNHRGLARVPIAGKSRLLDITIDIAYLASHASTSSLNFIEHCIAQAGSGLARALSSR